MTTAKASASVSYAVSLYNDIVDKLGPRAAYDAAVTIAGLRTAAERAEMRAAIMVQQKQR